ncbi:MAG: hypothetical protein Q8L85_00410 [Alphaproteobacteria bacterium]|nr:hypothetical protein [Alphaproteobacteria bacterium]
MKMHYVKSLFLGAVSLLILNPSFADNDHQFEFGPEFSHHSLNEKIGGANVNKLEGPMVGVQGSWLFHMGRNFLSVNPRYLASKQKYSNKTLQTHSKGHDSLFELRGNFGRDFELLADASISPYIGIGYRLFRNQAGKSFGGTYSWGHLSGTNYLYIPIGFDTKFKLQDLLSLTFNAELDVLISGSSKGTRFGRKVETHNSKGYGFRSSIGLAFDFASFTLEGKPYVRYWSVDASGHKCGFCGRFSQPKTTSTELGFGLSVKL